ncbi:hypothetical protein CK203_035781 [Vitis vinifera]|uniref:RING-type domain-containing protein n=1 Tax=Vitis vinifera TaxID=29760 RepID=A0A438FYT5_VITVI|nr:hypothetical protein CK203_035781 [Vitis vinifera]
MSLRGLEERGKGKLPPGKELQYGRVSAAELEQLKESQAALLLEQDEQAWILGTSTILTPCRMGKADMAAKEADTAKASWMCRVCLSAEVDITIIPCGHVLCRRCSSAVSRCPFCRLQVSKTMKIYRP